MAKITILRSMFRLLLLLTVFVLAAVGSKNEQASLRDSSGFATTPRSTNNNAIIVTATGQNEVDKSSSIDHIAKNVSGKNVSWNDEEDEDEEAEDEEEENDDDDDDDEDEGEVNNADKMDEYEDELREIAESHEAMSRDERRTGISSTTSSDSLISVNRSFVEHLVGTRNFDSRENIDEMILDDSSVSNEALPKDDDDEEVAELLRYKQKGTSSLVEGEVGGDVSELGTKVKRVPTVKKELSTQKEIITSNETQLTLPKTLISNVEIVNRLDDETKNERRYGVPVTSRDPNRYELVRDDTDLDDEEYSDVETPADVLRKLEKRQPSEVDGLRSYFFDGHSSELEQRRKLRELGIEEGALAESLMELLTRLAEDPRLRRRLHRILEDVERDLSFTPEILSDSQKRAHSLDSLVQISLTDSPIETPDGSSTTTKQPKKKKKKRRKKKPRHRFTSTTSTKTPTTIQLPNNITSSPAPPLLTTTSSNWPVSTQPQWRLVAERLFGSPWSDDLHESPPSMTKVRSVKDRLGSIDEKQRDSLKALNDERQALMLQSAREYSQPRRLHYGKVNTHEKGSPSASHDSTVTNYDSERDSRMLDYDLSDRSYQRPMSLDRYDRYGQYGRQRIRDYGVNPIEPKQQQQQDNNYDDIFHVSEGITNHRPFARTQQFRPLGREYASTKTWQDSRYDYPRSWNDKSRTSLDDIPSSNGNWPWRPSSTDYKIWIPRYRAWSRDRNYWRRLGNVEDELDEIENDEDNVGDSTPRNWQRNQPEQQSWRPAYRDDSTKWQHVDRNADIPTWQVHERPKSEYNREVVPVSLEKSKNRSELNNKEAIVKSVIKDKPIVPKITMKTWNSLTSDPATWPFKLTGAKPWPKDKNGKSYNPNAELVRKLGLDKQQDHLLSSSKDSLIGKEIVPQDSPKYKIRENSGQPSDGRNEIGTIVNSAKSSISWPDKLSAVNEWNSVGKSREENERSPQRDEARQIWQTNGPETNRKMWSGKSPISPKISSVGAWVMPADQSTWRPYDLKHTAYGQLSEGPSVRWNLPTNSEETDARSWSTKNEAMSASWPQKINNGWNVGGSVYSAEKTNGNSHSSTWPSKWRQFAYHKVTASPIAKPGSSNILDPLNRPRNSYIAVSAVSAPKYSNNEWRKNDIEETQLDRSAGDNHGMNFNQDDPSSQLQKNLGKTNERWNKQARIGGSEISGHPTNLNDPLEHQLEELRQAPYWNHEQMHDQSQKRSNASGVSSMTVGTTQSSRVPTNSSIIKNENSKNHEGSSQVVQTQAQEKKNETK